MRHCPRRAGTAALALLLSSALLASTASAMPSVDLFFTELNGSAIPDSRDLGVRPGDRVGVEMRVTGDDRGVAAYSLSVDFDSAAAGVLQLDGFENVLSAGFVDILGPGPQGPDDPLGAPGYVRLFTATTALVPGGLESNPFTVNGTFLAATLEFTVTDEILNGPASVAPGLFHVGVDEIISNEIELIGGDFDFVPIQADFDFASATLTLVPEPGTALLVASGLLALGRARRRRR